MECGSLIDEALEFVELSVCSSSNDECLKRFIETYESLPELWDRAHPNYMKKDKKRTALEKLLVIYREIKPQAVIKDVTKKLNTLRSNYRRELNKIKSSIRSGCGTDEVYKPTSWVFYALQFLGDSVTLASLGDQNDKLEESQELVESASNLLQPATSSIKPYPPPPKKKKFRPHLFKQNELYKVAKPNELVKVSCDFPSNKINLPEDDEYFNIAKVWAYKLKNLQPLQKILTQKAINDLIFEAEMGTFHKDFLKINVPGNSSSSLSGLTSIPSSPPPAMSTSYESAVNYFTNFKREQSSSAAMKPKSGNQYQNLSLTVPKPFVYHVVLNRPIELNTFNLEMFLEITHCFKSLHNDEDCRVILLSGSGKQFSAGLNLTSVTSSDETLAEHNDISRRCKVFRELITAYQEAILSPEKCVKPVISLVHNGCIGAGTNLVTSVDVRYCTEDAYFQLNEVESDGMAANIGALQRLPHIIGSLSLANEFCLAGRKMGAKESQEAGFVSKVFKDKESMMTAGLELAESLAQKSPVLVQLTKRNILYSRAHGVEAGLQHIADWNQIMLQSEDFTKAVMAFTTKNPPPSTSKL